MPGEIRCAVRRTVVKTPARRTGILYCQFLNIIHIINLSIAQIWAMS